MKSFLRFAATFVFVGVILGIGFYGVHQRFFSELQEAEAGTADNTSGWAWSENIGWISFNCTDPGTCGTVNYGVHIDSSTGNFSGYAWSENIGWISFNRADTGTPPGPPYNGAESFIAKLDFPTKEVRGWARALAFGGGWDGWIKLRKDPSDAGAAYGVLWNSSTQELEGWAWSDMVVGWVSFNCKDPVVCPTSNYKVIAAVDIIPPDTTITSAPPNPDSSTSASFSFTSTESGSTFACELDGVGFSVCTSPKSYTGLSASSHTFKVRATDLAGNTDPTPASHTWLINSPPSPGTPATLIIDPIPPATGSTVDSGTGTCQQITTLQWTYSDPDGNSQQAARIQVDESSPGDFAIPVENKLLGAVIRIDLTHGGDTGPADLRLPFGGSFVWRVQVQDNLGQWSSWVQDDTSFSTVSHAPPSADFTFSPAKPSAKEPIRFTDTSSAATGFSVAAWKWDFLPDGNPTQSLAKNPVVTFLSTGIKQIKLKVTDSATPALSCSIDQTKFPSAGPQVKLQSPLPKFFPVVPF